MANDMLPSSVETTSTTIQQTKSHPLAESTQADIIDIRSNYLEADLKNDIVSMFNPPAGVARQLPTILLYDERGLQLFEAITYMDEYYLTGSEIDLLQRHAAEIADWIPPGSIVVELGSGNLRKVGILLQALEEAEKSIDYYALDLSRSELARTLAQLPPYRHVHCRGLWGTYDDGQAWLSGGQEARDQPKLILHLGSSIGNFDRDGAVTFLSSFADAMGSEDKILVGIDACADGARVYDAYNDAGGTTHEFILNGLNNANKILGEQAFKLDEWRVAGEYVHDGSGGRHQAFVTPFKDTTVLGSVVRKDERIKIEHSMKYSSQRSDRLWEKAGLKPTTKWVNGGENEYGLHLLEKRPELFSLDPTVYAKSAMPDLEAWEALWVVWDTVTTGMLPADALLSKPIELRNPCIFYLGHIPNFLDIQLTKTLRAVSPQVSAFLPATTPPASYGKIFERGIDPDVNDPAVCHAHSEIPDEWPPAHEIAMYKTQVRSRLRLALEELDTAKRDGRKGKEWRNLARAVWLAFEHEAMHLETLLYMMLQSNATLPPPGTRMPDFAGLQREARAARVENQWFRVPEQDVTIGLDDPEDGEEMDRHFGWDNEKPERLARVKTFELKGRPITNEEYAKYMVANNISKLPASWADLDGSKPNVVNGFANSNIVNGSSYVSQSFLKNKAVRTVYGPVPLKFALDWPVFASFDELEGCAGWMGGRIPTFEEVRSAYAYVDHLKREAAERQLGTTVPAVNGHLCNEGVEETPPAIQPQATNAKADGLFVDLAGTNVGFRHWHPMPVTGAGDKLAGRGELGGVWEWTSSTLERHDGFEPMPLYPAYTMDFFDGKHNIMLGGSWATHPRVAGRQSFISWYQRNYPYAWAGARLARDI